MTNASEIPWKRIAVEAVAIVGSILLAFAIDAWWDDTQQKAEERIVLQSVLDELQGVQIWQREDFASAIEIRESILRLLRETYDLDSVSGEQLDKLLSDTLWSNPSTSYNVPVLTSLVSSGDLSIISDPSLRLELGAWSARFEDVAVLTSRDNAFLFDRTMPFYSENASLLQLLNTVDCRPGVPTLCWNYGERIDPGEAVDHSPLLSSSKFQGMLSERLLIITDVIDFALDGLGQDLTVTIDNVRRELAH